MRTTVYINKICFDRIKGALKSADVSRNRLIAMLLNCMAENSNFKAEPFKPVKYQDSDPEADWITMHVKFKPVLYEKLQDLRRNYKFSVSWFVSYAVCNYLDEIIKELTCSQSIRRYMDNYVQNFVHLVKMYGQVRGFITFWGIPDENYMKKLLE